MKVTFDIDCTPEEARKFLGLPDVAPMQEAMMKDIEDRMRDNLNNLEPEAFMKTWLPMMNQNFTDMQKMFWGQMGVNTSADDKKSKDKK